MPDPSASASADPLPIQSGPVTTGPGIVPEPPDRPASESGGSPYAVLRCQGYLLYLISRFIASFAQQMLAVAVGWEIYDRTHKPLALGIVGLVQMVPMFLFTFPAGHVADNYSRKRVMLWTQLGLAASAAGMAAVTRRQAPVEWTYVCLFAMGAARTYLWPSSASFLPQLVPRELFARAIAWNTGSFQIAAVAGPAAGGALIALSGSALPVYVFNFVAGLVCFALIAVVRSEKAPVVREPMSLKSVAVGLEFIYRNKVILGSISLDMFAVLLGGATAMLPVYCKDILRSGPSGLGVLQAALPFGSMLMALVLVHRPPLERAGTTLLWAVAIFGVATVAFGYSRIFWFSFVMLFVCGAADYISVLVRHTLVQLLTPDEMRGRVSAVNSLFIGTSNQLGDFESGFAASIFGPVIAVVSGGVGTILVVIATAVLWPEIRKYGRLDA
jgi:MFS family permease